MNHRDAELSDVMIVLMEEPGMTIQDAVARLKELGLSISDVDQDNDVIEGTIEAVRVKSLETLPFVKYVRKLFDYVADFPAGDPRNLDNTDDDGDVDDAL